ncbi:outer membrane protein assembly factor BamA [Halioxenophilus sp. WMMB6]|uniref:outer membrane protein assembly factor BamA n=1 Tax=Halioxenophilus sp. WMMB6 TaxID=3073815 RepID=UPI00295EFADF|nr:outer membrane protein assembly factor BamA [Halioxenophilus sp. WMMB6]
MSRLFICCVFSLLFSVAASAESFRVDDIRVQGLQRVSAGTVFAALPIQVGDQIEEVDIQRLTRALFRTGFFEDIAIGRDGNVLVVVVAERPAISSITLDGNKAIKSEDLLQGLTDNGLSEGQIFKRATLEGLTQELERQYVAQGRYSASVDAEVVQLPRNQVEIKINVDEGKVAKIRHVNVVGNHQFDEQELLDLFELGTGGWFSWFSSKNKYSKEKLSGDLERLESFYLDRGYLKFSIDSTQVSLSPDKEGVYITVNITEGDVYKVSEVELAGDLVVDESIIRRLILVSEGQNFSQVLMTTTSEYITKRLGNEGYTFADVRGIPERNDDDKTVKITFFVDPGKRAYVRRIDFRGNTKTSDEVLRREMRQMEGGSASTAAIEQSKVRLERLGFFKEVNVDTREVPGSSDQVDVEYTVEEQPSGSIGASIGYAQGTGLTLGANVQQDNWFGTGKSVGFALSRSKYQTVYSFNFNDPYFTPDGVSRGFSVYLRKRDFGQFGVATYNTDTYGASVSFGYPTSEISRLSMSFGYNNIAIDTGAAAVQEIRSSPRLLEGDLVSQSYVTQEIADQIDLLNNDLVDDVNGDGIIDQSEIDLFLDSDGNRTDEATDGTIDPYDYTDLDTRFPSSDPVVVLRNPSGFIDKNGDSFNMFTVTLGWRESTLNRGRLATRGASQSISLEASVPGSDLEYYKFIYDAQYFQPLTRDLTLRLRTQLGYADAYGNTTELPFFEHFYGGGFGSVRGFERNTLGPRASPAYAYNTVYLQALDNNGDGIVDQYDNLAYIIDDETGQLSTRQITRSDSPFGGNVSIEFGAEVLFPLPFIKDQRSLQSAFFIDAGNVFDTSCAETQLNCYDVDLNKLSSSFGLGLTWITGFGPLTFSIAKPIKSQEEDKREFFQFSLGTAF